ncbi:MAG: DUF2029 domain-containing protein [Anaerolineales bacterium]|nr:DUF2029 domain-containing protein [Anaerolineales bacterium]
MLVIIAVAAVALLAALAALPALRPIDFVHYTTATKMLLRGEDPYQAVEFFFPPWSVLFLGPFALLPPKIAAGAWLVLASFSQVLSGALTLRWYSRVIHRRMHAVAHVLPALLPSALYSYVTGQITPVIGLAVLLALWVTSHTSVHPIILALLLGIATFKPHIVAIPASICLLELLRGRKWMHLVWLGVTFAALAGVGYAVLPNWASSLSNAWLGGAYRGGPGLVAKGYRGLIELGVPYWLLVPTLAYTLHAWAKDHLSTRVVAFAITAGVLLAPYTRSYDQVLLTFPAVLGLLGITEGKRLAGSLIVTSSLLLPLTPAWMLAPVITFIGLLILYPSSAEGSMS